MLPTYKMTLAEKNAGNDDGHSQYYDEKLDGIGIEKTAPKRRETCVGPATEL